MVKKRYLSKKKTSRQTITISPFLKDWLKRFVKEKHEEKPENENYRSVSSFVTYLIEENLKLLEKGKTLEDLKGQPDRKTEKFYDKITFKAITQQFEEVSETAKYTTDDFDFLFPLFSKYRLFMIQDKKSEGEQFTVKDFIRGTERLNNFMRENSVTKNFSIEQIGEKLILEYSGYYPNIHFILSKGLVVIGSIMGFSFLELFYEKNYMRIDFVPTDLFSNPKMLKNERKKLYFKNIKHLVNYYHLIRDKKHHLWLNMATNPNAIISFRSVKAGFEQIKEMIDEIYSNSIKEERPEYILEIFRKFGWIDKKFEKLSYEILISREENQIEIEIMEKIYQYIKRRHILKDIKKEGKIHQFIL